MYAAGTPGSVDGTQNEQYYLRLHLLLMKAGDVLRSKFDSIITPNNLFHELRNHKREIDKLKKDGILSNAQYNLLNPNPDSRRFDVSLLIVLLRNICNLQPNNPIWKEKYNSNITDTMHPVIANIVRIRNLRNEMQHKHVAYLDQEEFEDNWRLLEHAMVILGKSCGLNNVNAEIEDLATKTLDLVTPEMKSLRENTIWFFEESCNDEFFVETSRFKDANRLLKEKHFIVLTGHPGEGKTAMAARLALADDTKPENCVKLEYARDWRKVDWSLKLFITVIVDDIFGGGSLNQKLLADWEPYLPEMERAARQKRLRIIITTRHYIKEEAMEELDKPTLFDDKKGYVLLLSSTRYLSFHEKKKILVSRAKKNNSENMITTHRIKYDDCIRKAEGVMNLQKDQREDFVFGFPQCATLFVRSEELIKLGPVFFSKPEIHFKTYIDQLYKGRDEEQFHKFLALVAVWAANNMRMTEHDLRNAKNVSDHVKFVANCFGIDVTNSFLETLKSSLKSHFIDLLLLIDRSGEYTFSHNVNGDMVGVVLGSHKLLECIELCPRDFLMERVTIEPARKDELRVVVPKKHFDALCEKFAKNIGKTNCNLVTKEPPHDEFQQLQRKGPRPSTVHVLNGIDFGLLKHSAFKNEGFVKQFIRYIRENHLDQDLFTVPVMKMTGYFLNYGIKMTEMVMYLPGYTLYSGLIVLAKELIGQEAFPKEQIDPLLLATHFGDIDMMRLLLSHGSKVSGDTLCVAMHKGSTFDSNEVLDTIVEYQGIDINDKGNAVNGNYPLIFAAKKGLTYEVKCLLQHGADPSVKNDKNLTALHKAVKYKHSHIIQLLIDHDSPLDGKGGTFQRSPLHIAADLGMSKIVKKLLKKGANVKVKDNCGHYPIFLAAIGGHFDTVRILLKHDKSQDSLRIAHSNKTCSIKGMSLMHVAVWRNDINLIELLIDGKANPNGKDFFGQTPLLYAIMTGKETATRLLLQYADKTVPQKQGLTPLHAAIIKGNFKLVAKLAAEVNVNEADKYGRTPLHVACDKGDINVVYLLLKKHNADPLIITNQGDTVFHILRQTERNKSHEEHCKRRLIEELIIEAHPAIFDRVKGMPNNNGVYITDCPKLASKDLITIKVLRQAINCDFDEIIADVDDVRDTRDSRARCIYDRSWPMEESVMQPGYQTPPYQTYKHLYNTGESWRPVLEPEFNKPYFAELTRFVCDERRMFTVYPSAENVFSWTRACPLDQVQLVILGQDPYHGPNQAHGLSFSVQPGIPPPPSLRNIFKLLEIFRDFNDLPTVASRVWQNKISTFFLELLALNNIFASKIEHEKQRHYAMCTRVLMLNSVLTVREGSANSHAGKGSEQLTDAVIAYLNDTRDGLVFVLWGSYAQKKGAHIDKERHLVLKSVHPSPLSAYKGFFECGHFSKVNAYLRENGKDPINWSHLPPFAEAGSIQTWT